MRLLVTGGAGFIGSAVIRHFLAETEAEIVNLDKLTYAADLRNLGPWRDHPRHVLEKADICDGAAVATIFQRHRPDAVLHLAAESHVDRSIAGPAAFVETNILGTYTLLEAALRHWRGLEGSAAERFRFHHVSTDEVFGSLGASGAFSEATAYDPSSPYSASKAASDHLVQAWGRTYGLPVLLSNCSNNYGPYQFPDKLIPLMIINGLAGKPLPVYGQGTNIRDWLFVEDHARALAAILDKGEPGRRYVIGGRSERSNRQVVDAICRLLDECVPLAGGAGRDALVTLVADRPGHDFRYAIDPARLERELGIAPIVDFATGLRRTVEWYVTNEDWWRPIVDERYRGERLGLLGQPA